MTKNVSQPHGSRVRGICAVLGTDIAAFSLLTDEDQVTAVGYLMKWVRTALGYHEIDHDEYHWR